MQADISLLPVATRQTRAGDEKSSTAIAEEVNFRAAGSTESSSRDGTDPSVKRDGRLRDPDEDRNGQQYGDAGHEVRTGWPGVCGGR